MDGEHVTMLKFYVRYTKTLPCPLSSINDAADMPRRKGMRKIRRPTVGE